MNKKTVLITGASSGIGETAARWMIDRNYKVYVAARRTERLEPLEKLGAVAVKLDVTSEESMTAAVEFILKQEQSIDILVNNAGYGSYGAVEDVTMEEARRQFDVNLFGAARLTQLVLPSMRKQRWGRIINVSSIGGKIYSPFGAWYHATKHALEGWSDCLRLEVKPFGIDVTLIQPGAIKSEWDKIAAQGLKKWSAQGAYGETALSVAEKMEQVYERNRASHPEVIARIIEKAASARRPRTRHNRGYMSGISLFVRRWTSDRFFDNMIKWQMGM